MMYLPPPRPILNKDVRISGEVEIHPTASLAQGVILQAAPNCKIVIGADVCIGMGAIINASEGVIEIDSGAILGSGVLIFGACKIGNNSCIGTSTTIFQEDVAPMKVIEPGSIVGDLSRKYSPETIATESPEKKNSFSQNINHQQSSNQQFKEQVSAQIYPEAKNGATAPPAANAMSSPKEPVVGQLYINELLITLFPHRKKSN